MLSSLNCLLRSKLVFAICLVLICAVFILSGLGKIADIANFKDFLHRQNFHPFVIFFALLIPPLEVLSCAFIILNVRRKLFLYVLLFLTLIFTSYLLYLHFNGFQEDCRCFGQIKFLNLPTTLSLFKNLILTLLILYALFYLKSEPLSIKFSKELFLYVFSILVFFFSSFSAFLGNASEHFHLPENQPDHSLKQKIIFSKSIISEILSLSPDSSYLLYVFNPDCYHCALSVENVKSFMRNRVIDKIIGISSATPNRVKSFSQKFDLNFETILASENQIRKFSPSLPTVFIVRNDTIISRMTGEIIPSYLFRK
jgi:uncharacterized membrane protein YphA (DoxX/SURF4 family)